MEGVAILLVLLILGLPIVAIVVAARAHGRIERIERALNELRAVVRPPPEGAPHPPTHVTIPLTEKAERLQRVAAPEPLVTPTPGPAPAATSAPVSTPMHTPAPVPAPRPVVWTPPPRVEHRTPVEDVAPVPPLDVSAPPPKRVRLEEQLGTRLPVWIGSIALFLAGAFLVKYTFDKGLLTPAARVIIGVIFGVALLAAGEWWRKRAARIAQGVTAAGVADLFACFLAATNLYHLVSREMGFGLLALNTGIAVVLSLRQGPFVALLGLLGGFMTPALIGAEEPHPGPLFSYLFVLQAGLLVITRRRRWWPLAALTLTGALIWSGLWLAYNFTPEHSPWLGPFLLASVAAFVAAMYRARPAEGADLQIEHALALLGAVAGTVMLAVLVHVSGFSPLDWVFLGLLGAGALVLGRLDVRYELLAWCAAAAGLVLLINWHFELGPDDAGPFSHVALTLGALYALGGYACLWGARNAARWASLSVAAAFGYLLLAYWTLPQPPLGWRWGLICLILAAAYAVASAPIIVNRAKILHSEFILAAMLTGVTAFVSLAVPIELERAWIAVAWALEIPALALVFGWLRVPALRTLAAGLAWLSGVWLFQPGAVTYPLGTHPVFDWILYGYGVSAIAFAAGAWLFHRFEARRLAEGLVAGTVVFVFALVTLKVRRYFHVDGLMEGEFALREWATYVSAWFVLSMLSLAATRAWLHRVLRAAGHVIAVLGLVLAVVALGLAQNPYWVHESVGAAKVLNSLLYAYGLPAVLLFAVTAQLHRGGELPVARIAAAIALLFVFLLVTLEVRQWFHGEFLDGGEKTSAESYAYSAAWVVLGTLLLLSGIVTRGVVLRWASLLVMLLAVGKVFLFDTAHLRDLYRVFSLLGLGVSLMLLAFLYQRFVFGKRPEAA